jgi:peroxiredoxin
MLRVGERMPAFVLHDTERQPFTQEDFAGAIAVIAFYPAAFTGG